MSKLSRVCILVGLLAIGVRTGWAQCLTGPYCSAAIGQAVPAVTGALSNSNPITDGTNDDFWFSTRVTNATYATNQTFATVGGFTVSTIGGSLFLTGGDTGTGGTCTVSLTSASSDIQILVVRSASTMTDYLLVWDTHSRNQVSPAVGSPSENGATCVYTITALASRASIKSAGVVFGSTTGTGQAAYLRVGTGSISRTVAPPIGISSATNAGDWEFGAALGSNESPGSPNDVSSLGQTLSGTLVYSETPQYNPACQTYITPSARASAGTLTLAPSCSPLDGGPTLTYSWSNSNTCATGSGGTQAPSPSTATTVTWSPTGLVSGCFNAALTVTDGSSLSTSYVFHAGLVTTDSNGIVDYSGVTGYSHIVKWLGPQCHYSDAVCTAKWPWLDNRHRALVDVQVQNMSASTCPYTATNQCYLPWWRTFSTLPQNTGTITITGNSVTVTGSGTTFTSAVSSGTTPKSGALLMIRYTGIDSRTHYTLRPVTAIASNTSLTLGQIYPLAANLWGALPNCDSGCSGLSFSLHWDGVDGSEYGTWSLSGAPANYYDNVVALYSMWLRSGIDTYLTAARTLADKYWEAPAFDQGTSCSLNVNYAACPSSRSWSLMGLMIRMEEGGLQSTMLPGLRIMWRVSDYLANTYYYTTISSGGAPQIIDLREQAYWLAPLAYCSEAETNATYAFSFPYSGTNATQKADCLANVATNLNVWNNFGTGPGWYGFSAYPGSTTSSVNNGYINLTGAGNVDVANGSATVTGHSTNFDCATINGGLGHWLLYVWVPNTGAGQTAQDIPSYSYIVGGGGDTTYYEVTCNSTTQLTVIKNSLGASSTYQGMTGTGKGFALAPDPASGLSNSFLGWGQQPYSQGIAGIVFNLAGDVLASNGYPTEAAQYYAHSATSAAWEQNYALDTTSGKGGMYIGVYVNCGNPINIADVQCGNPSYTADQNRQLNAEVVKGVQMEYTRVGTTGLKTFGDLLINQMWCQPTFGGTCTPDGYYLNQYADGGIATSGAPPGGSAPKWTGQAFGFSQDQGWLTIGIGLVVAGTGGVTGGKVVFGVGILH